MKSDLSSRYLRGWCLASLSALFAERVAACLLRGSLLRGALLRASLRWVMVGTILPVMVAGCDSAHMGRAHMGRAHVGPEAAANLPILPSPLRTGADLPQELRTVNLMFVQGVQVDRSVAAEHSSFFEHALRAAAREELSFGVIFGEDLAGSLEGGALDEGVTTKRAVLAPSVEGAVRRRGVDSVLTTTVTQYTPRVGSRVGVDQPARVDFAMELRRLRDGVRLWESSYHFKDEALTENLLRAPQRLEGGGGFRRADDLFERGVRLALRDLAARREEQFSKAR